MAVLSGITAVRPTTSTGAPERVQWGATVTAGQPVYRAADSKCSPADADLSLAASEVIGMAMTGGANLDYGYILKTGNVILVGAVMTPGVAYYVGPTVGTIVPAGADLTTGCNVTRLFTSVSATEAKMSIEATGAVV